MRLWSGSNPGKTSLLVSTTVIEVGIDVPNATIMVIEHSERFGLFSIAPAQRSSRPRKQSQLLHKRLFGDKLSQEGKQRLKIFSRNYGWLCYR